MTLQLPKKPRFYQFFVACLTPVVLFFFIDQAFAQWIEEPQFERIRFWSREVTNIGLGDWWYALSFLILVISWWTLKNARGISAQRVLLFQTLKKWAFLFLMSLTTTGLVLQITKHIVGRQRPHVSPEHWPWVFHPLTAHWHWHSFPSGHAQVMGCVAAAAALLWPRTRHLTLAICAAFALTRPITLQHFLSDIWVGFFLGYWGSQLTYQITLKKFKAGCSRLGIE